MLSSELAAAAVARLCVIMKDMPLATSLATATATATAARSGPVLPLNDLVGTRALAKTNVIHLVHQ